MGSIHGGDSFLFFQIQSIRVQIHIFDQVQFNQGLHGVCGELVSKWQRQRYQAGCGDSSSHFSGGHTNQHQRSLYIQMWLGRKIRSTN
jgi:hypothetical protein